MLPVTLSLPHALPMVQHILPVTFRMEVCSLPSSLEETDARTLQPIIQFVLILQTKSQIAHRQTYGSKVMLWFTWLRRGLRSCCQVCTTFVCSTAQFHCLNPPSICSGGDHGGSWSSKCCPKSWSLPLVHSCSELLLLLHHRALSWSLLFTCPPSSVAMHSTLRKPEDLPLIATAGTHSQVGDDTGLSHLQCPPCSLDVSPAVFFVQQYYNTFV